MDQLAQWAAQFLAAQKDEPLRPPRYPTLTRDGSELLQSVDEGGIPAFVTSNLRRIAEENGLQITSDWTPNRIVSALREKAVAAPLSAQLTGVPPDNPESR